LGSSAENSAFTFFFSFLSSKNSFRRIS
jgi:hypothetical protein